MKRLAMAMALFGLMGSCERPRFTSGEGCEVSSDCASPLVCVLDACRRQCVDSRDCGAGLRCLVVDSELGGGCQLDDEVQCTLSSDCAREGTICQNRECTTPCRVDRDCASGQTCSMDMHMVLGCYEERDEGCLYNSDCSDPMICSDQGVCRLECLSDRDCTTPRRCVASLCELFLDGGP